MLSVATGPSAEILPGEITFDGVMGNGIINHMGAVVRVTTGTAVDLGAQKRLREFRDPSGPDSVRAALESDRTLGGLVDYTRVTRIGPMRQFRRPDGETVLGCDFEVEITGDP